MTDLPWRVETGVYVCIFNALGHPILTFDTREKPNALEIANRIVDAVNGTPVRCAICEKLL